MQTPLDVAYKLLPGALPPRKAHAADAGWDLSCRQDVTLEAGRTKKLYTGVYLAIPEGWFGLVLDRSSLAARGLYVTGGVIDPGYRGEVAVVLTNFGCFEAAFKRGDRVAQIAFLPAPQVMLTPVQAFGESERSGGGFGSTGA